jgi:hypothetical protein
VVSRWSDPVEIKRESERVVRDVAVHAIQGMAGSPHDKHKWTIK